ncbi:hypothetical protein [Hydrogenimonas sp.]
MAIIDDFSVDTAGNIRHVAGTTVYSVYEMNLYLQDLADNLTEAGDDQLSIIRKNPSALAGKAKTDVPMAMTLLNGYNVDDTATQFVNFGSIEQNNGADLYTGLKTIGSPLVALSPMYIVQNGAKLTKFWGDGHIQILVKAKSGGTLIDGGNVRVFSRKYGQTYADFETNLAAGSEQVAAITTEIDSNIYLTETEAAAIASNVAITVGDTTQDIDNGNGPKLYKGTISLANGVTLKELYNYLQYKCREASTDTINGVEGWQYRALDPAYTPNSKAPFGTFAGGKFFFAQGWWVEGVLASEAQSYELIADDGTTQVPPITTGLTLSNLAVGDSVTVGRDDETTGWFKYDELTVSGAHPAGSTTITMTAAIPVDTPTSGFLRVNKTMKLEYTSWSGSTFTLSSATASDIADASPAYVPFIDEVVVDTSRSVTFKYNGDFNVRIIVRNSPSIVSFETTALIGQNPIPVRVVRTPAS